MTKKDTYSHTFKFTTLLLLLLLNSAQSSACTESMFLHKKYYYDVMVGYSIPSHSSPTPLESPPPLLSTVCGDELTDLMKLDLSMHIRGLGILQGGSVQGPSYECYHGLRQLLGQVKLIGDGITEVQEKDLQPRIQEVRELCEKKFKIKKTLFIIG